MLRRIIPTAERTVTRGGNKTIDKGDAIRERFLFRDAFGLIVICGHPVIAVGA
jgi:hypothetical protein